jgi:hypothetical protein
MPLLFWYLPFMIVAGAFDALYEQDGRRSLEVAGPRPLAGDPHKPPSPG